MMEKNQTTLKDLATLSESELLTVNGGDFWDYVVHVMEGSASWKSPRR